MASVKNMYMRTLNSARTLKIPYLPISWYITCMRQSEKWNLGNMFKQNGCFPIFSIQPFPIPFPFRHFHLRGSFRKAEREYIYIHVDKGHNLLALWNSYITLTFLREYIHEKIALFKKAQKRNKFLIANHLYNLILPPTPIPPWVNGPVSPHPLIRL